MAKKQTEPDWIKAMLEPRGELDPLIKALNGESARLSRRLQNPGNWPGIMAASRQAALEIERHEKKFGLTRPAARIGAVEVGAGVDEVLEPAAGIGAARKAARPAPVQMMRNNRRGVDDHPGTPACARDGCYPVPEGSRPKKKTWLEMMRGVRDLIARIGERAGTP